MRFVPGAAPELREGFDELLKGRSGRGSCIAVDDAWLILWLKSVNTIDYI